MTTTGNQAMLHTWDLQITRSTAGGRQVQACPLLWHGKQLSAMLQDAASKRAMPADT